MNIEDSDGGNITRFTDQELLIKLMNSRSWRYTRLFRLIYLRIQKIKRSVKFSLKIFLRETDLNLRRYPKTRKFAIKILSRNEVIYRRIEMAHLKSNAYHFQQKSSADSLKMNLSLLRERKLVELMKSISDD